VFWVYGLLINLGFFAAGVISGYLQMLVLLVPLLPFYLAFLVWFFVAAWRCAHNSSWSGWAYLARAWVVLASVGFSLKVVQAVSKLVSA